MTTIFIFSHFGLNICHPFLYFATLKGFVFIIGKLVWLWCSNSLQNRKNNMTKNHDPLPHFTPAPPEARARHCPDTGTT